MGFKPARITWSLNALLAAIIVTAVVTVLGIQSAYTIVTQRHAMLEQLKQNSALSISSLQKNVGPLIEAYAVNEYGKLVATEIELKHHDAIVIEDYSLGLILGKASQFSGKIHNDAGRIVDFDPDNPAHRNHLKKAFHRDTASILDHTGKTIGKVTVYASNSEINRQLSDMLLQNLLSTLLIAALLIVSLLYAIHRLLLRPLTRVSSSMTETDSDGIPRKPAPEFALKEINTLSQAINHMVLFIRQSRDLLHQEHERLQTMEQRWNFALEAAGEGVWDWDVTTCNVTFSKRWYEIQGFVEGEIGTDIRDWEKLVHPDDVEMVKAQLRAHFEGRTPTFVCEHRVACKDGHYKWILGRGMVIGRDAQGNPLRVIGTHTDITGRKQTEAEREHLLRIIEEAPDFIATADMESKVQFLNAAGAQLIGLPEGYDLSSLQIKDMHPIWGTKLILEVGIPAVLQHGFWRGENALLHRDGHEIPVSQLLLLHRDAAGVPRLLSTIMRDISDVKLTEAELKRARDAAEMLAHTKAEFLANMSHEIRTPMNGIIGLSQLALNQPTTPQLRDYLQKISSSSQSLLCILNDILDFSKLEVGRVRIEPVRFDLDLMLLNLRSLFEEHARAKSLDLIIQVSPGTPRDLVGDAMRLQQILSNLLGNAVKFTSKGHVALKIGVRQTYGSQVVLGFTVEDSGIGIAEEDRVKLFQPFSQIDGSITRRFGGTGLGLAISHDLLHLMGGEINVSSQPGEGTTFDFFLPLEIADNDPELEQASHPVQPDAGELQVRLQDQASSLNGAHILVAEDNAINQQVVREFLTLSGMEVSIASNGQEALDLLKQNHYDAVLMDAHMPVMDGMEATRKIRSNPAYRSLPVIALTAGVTEGERERCLASGMNDFVAKPINPEHLIDSLRRWVGSDWCPETEPMPDEVPLKNNTLLILSDRYDEVRQMGGLLSQDFMVLVAPTLESMRGIISKGATPALVLCNTSAEIDLVRLYYELNEARREVTVVVHLSAGMAQSIEAAIAKTDPALLTSKRIALIDKPFEPEALPLVLKKLMQVHQTDPAQGGKQHA